MTMWDTEADDQTPEYKIKSHLVLEGSSTHNLGVVKDCHGCINYIPEDAEVVGTWNKYGDGMYWVSLETPIQALVDKATLLFMEIHEERKKYVRSPKAPTRRSRTPTQESNTFDDLRRRLEESKAGEMEKTTESE